jgi:transcriptional regulator with XRE-family HTH domain
VAKTVGQVLRALREDAGISRSALARAAKMEPGALFRVENGASPSFEMVSRVAKALGVTLDDVATAVGARGARLKADAADAQVSEGLERLADVFEEGARIVSAMREGRSVSPPRRRRPQ